VALTGKAFDVLLVLLRSRGEVVTKDDLIAQVWPDTVVEDGNLGRNISRLRKALDESPDEHRYIVTLARSGYRFVADVRERREENGNGGLTRAADPPRPSRATRWPWVAGWATAGTMLLAGLAVLNTPNWRALLPRGHARPIHSLAVLPLANLTGDSGQDYLADGITEDLITELAEIKPLQVTSRTSVMQYKGARKPLKQIARELNVEAVLEGAAMRSGNRMHITAQLIRTDSDTHVWARSYDGDLRDVLDFESQVSRAIAREVAVQLDPRVDAHARPVSAEAYELYLKGRYFWNQRSPESVAKAADYFRKAIEKDPAYAPAYAGLADSCDLRALDIPHPLVLLAEAKAAATHATQLDDRLPEAHTSLAGEKVLGEWDWAGADREFQRALAIDPRYAPAHHWYATLYLAPLGRVDEAIAEAKKAVDLDPLSLIYNTDLGWMYALARRYDPAEERLKQVLEMDPHFIPAQYRLAGIYEARRIYGASVDMLAKIAISMGDPGAAASVERDYAASGYRGYVLQRLRHHRKLHGGDTGYGVAVMHLELGEKRPALDALRIAFAQHDSPMIFLKVDPVFDPLRADPGFQALERGVGLRP